VCEGPDIGNHVMDVAQRQLDHRHLIQRRRLAAGAGFRYLAPGFMHERPRRAEARLDLRKLELEARAIA